MTPDIIILNSQISYTNKLKEYLLLNACENVSDTDSLSLVCDNCEACVGRVIIASGKEIRYSDLLSATKAKGKGDVCPKARFILTYDGCSPNGDLGLAKYARCVKGGDNFDYILSMVKEEICDHLSKAQSNVEKLDVVRDLLDGLGFNSAHKGYRYILLALSIAAVERITKELYPEIAKKNKTTASAVERSIRSAVSAAWSHGGFGRFNRYIGWESTKCPTNSELIWALGIKAKIGLGYVCDEEYKSQTTIDF